MFGVVLWVLASTFWIIFAIAAFLAHRINSQDRGGKPDTGYDSVRKSMGFVPSQTPITLMHLTVLLSSLAFAVILTLGALLLI